METSSKPSHLEPPPRHTAKPFPIHPSTYSPHFPSPSFHSLPPDPLYKFPLLTLEKSCKSLTDTSNFILADLIDMKQTFSSFHQKSPFQRTGRSNLPSDASSYVSSYKNTLELSGSYLKSPRPQESSKPVSLASEASIVNNYLVSFNMDTGLSFSSVKSDEMFFNPGELSGIQWEEKEMLSVGLPQATEERTSEALVQLIGEDDIDDSRLLYNSIDALRKANLLEYEETDSVNEEGSIRISAATRLFLSGQTASKEKLADERLPKIVIEGVKLVPACPDLSSPIVRKIVVFEENEEMQMETRDTRNEIRAVQIAFVLPAVGFASTPQIEFSNQTSNSRAHVNNTSPGLPIISLFSAKVLRQVKNLNVLLVSCGCEHAAILTTDGKVLTWGYGASGCLGQESKKSYSHPKAINSIFNKQIIYLECGAYHTAAVSDAGEIWTWGRGDVNQLGLPAEKMFKDETGSCVLRPTKVKWVRDAVSVACGEAHTIVLTRSGKVFAFGWNEDSQLGSDDSNSEVRFVEKIVKIAAGALFSVALDEKGEVWVWGAGEQGQLGLGNSVKNAKRPVKILGICGVLDVVCGENSVLAFDRNGKVFGWGQGTVSSFNDTQSFPIGSGVVCFLPHEISEVDIVHRVLLRKRKVM